MVDGRRVDKVMEDSFERMYSGSMVAELAKENITDYERGRLAGRLECLKFLALEFNRVDEDEAKIIPK